MKGKKRRRIADSYPDVLRSDPDFELEQTLSSLADEGLDEEDARRAYEAFRGDFVDDM